MAAPTDQPLFDLCGPLLSSRVATTGSPQRLFHEAEQKLGPVDILLNNATGRLADTITANVIHLR